MTPLRDIIAAMSLATRHDLTALEFRKRKDDVYTLPLSNDAVRWVSLNRATYNHRGPLDVSPMIGVRDNVIERVVAELCGLEVHQYAPPTIVTAVGYLMPERTFKNWRFRTLEDVPLQSRAMVDAIRTYGLPFQESHETRESIVAYMQQSPRYPPNTFRLPIALWLTGRHEEAREEIRRWLIEYDNKTGPAMDLYRQFANAAETYFASHS